MKKKYFKWICVLIWMLVIFLFSSQNGSSSNNNNRFVIDLLKSIGINLDVIMGGIDDFIIRKLAHMTEYFILFSLLYNAVSEKFSLYKALTLSLVLTFIYASSDEFHQSFIPGRGPSFRDVMIDTGGGSIALCLLLLKNKLKRK